MSTERDHLRQQVAEIDWWHTIDLGEGVITPGKDSTPSKLAFIQMPADLTGKTVLDLGAWDGFFSFEAERRGAARVVALDYWTWIDGHKAGFEMARRTLGSRVEDVQLKVEDLSAERVGTFDVVLFLGLLYHVPNPIDVLERVASVTRELVVVETHVDLLHVRKPAAAFYPGDSLNGDETSWWGPNIAGCQALLQQVGFPDVTVVGEPGPPLRRLASAVRARRLEPLRRGRAALHGRKP